MTVQSVRIYSFMKELYIHSFHISYNFVKEVQHVLSAFVLSRQSLEALEQGIPSTDSQVFTDLHSNCPNHLPRFLPSYEDTEEMFYFLNNIQIQIKSKYRGKSNMKFFRLA